MPRIYGSSHTNPIKLSRMSRIYLGIALAIIILVSYRYYYKKSTNKLSAYPRTPAEWATKLNLRAVPAKIGDDPNKPISRLYPWYFTSRENADTIDFRLWGTPHTSHVGTIRIELVDGLNGIQFEPSDIDVGSRVGPYWVTGDPEIISKLLE